MGHERLRHDESEEHGEIRSMARRFFETERLTSIAGKKTPSSWHAVWRNAAALGWTDVGRPGISTGFAELLVIIEESGSASIALPLAASYCAQRLINNALQNTELEFHANGLGAGDETIAVCVASGFERVGETDSPVISGVVSEIEGITSEEGATNILLFDPVVGDALFISTTSKGVVVEPLVGFADPPLLRLSFDGAATKRLLLEKGMNHWLSVLRLAGVARAFGAANRAFGLALAWAKEREQFGRPIGAFQALQHKFADMAIQLDSTALLISRAAAAHDKNRNWQSDANCACTYGFPAMREVSLQVHHALAAVGFFEEHEAPQLFRRVHADALQYGGSDAACDSLAALVIRRGGLPNIDFGESAETFRSEVRAFLEEQLAGKERPKAVSAPSPEADALARALVDRGWTGLGWPKAVGGQALTAAEQFVFAEEMAYFDAPTGLYRGGEVIIGPTILAFGSDDQKADFLPRIIDRRVTFCLGYSEPGSGSDLASLKTRAVAVEDGWIINGSKLYTTGGQYADYIVLAARTDPDALPQKGISLFLLPMNSGGITVQPMQAMHGGTACAVYCDDVVAPRGSLLGPLHEGWRVLITALSHERMLMGATAASVRAQFDDLVGALTSVDEIPSDTLFRHRIGRAAAEIQAARLLAVRNVEMAEKGQVLVAEAAMSKLVTGELMESVAELALDLLGPRALLSPGSPEAALDGRFQRALTFAIMFVIGGGTNEIQRSIIATSSLGLPRAP